MNENDRRLPPITVSLEPDDAYADGKRGVSARTVEHKPGRRRYLQGTAVLVAIAGIGFVAFQFIGAVNTPDRGGSESPEEAVSRLMTAVEEGDALGVMSLLNPDEAGPVAESIETLSLAFEEMGLPISSGKITSGSVVFADSQLAVEELHDNVALVNVDFDSVDATFATTEIPYAVAWNGVWLPDEQSVDVEGSSDFDDFTADDGDVEPLLMVVKVDGGGWFVSPFYTIAQYVVELTDLDEPDFDLSADQVEYPEGFETPEELLDAMVDAIEATDPEEFAATLAPGEANVAQDYMQTIDDALERAGDLSDINFDSSDFDIQIEGDTAVAVVNEVAVNWTDPDGDYGTFEVSDECVTEGDNDGDGDTDRWCISDMAGDIDSVELLLPESFHLVLVRSGGAWYFSPVATIADYLQTTAEALDPIHMELMGFAEPVPITFGEEVTGTFEEEGELDIWSFELAEDSYIVMRLSATDGEVSADSRPDFSAYASADSNDSDVVFAKAGTYGVAVRPEEGGSEYTLRMDFAGRPDPDDEPLRPGTSLQVDSTEPGAVWVVKVESAVEFTESLSNSSGYSVERTTYMSEIEPADSPFGNSYARFDEVGAAIDDYDYSFTGYLIITAQPGETGGFELNLTEVAPEDEYIPSEEEYIPSEGSTTFLDRYGSTDGYVSYQATNYYEFVGDGSSATVSLTPSINGGDPDLTVLDSLGTLVGSSTSSTGTDSATFFAESGERYVIRVYGFAAADYSLTIQ